MPTYKILKNVLDFLEEKNELEKAGKAASDESIEVGCNWVSWTKAYPKVESAEQDEAKKEKKSILEIEIKDIVKVTVNRYYNSDDETWHKRIEVETYARGSNVDSIIPIRWYNFFHPQVIRAKRLFYKIERDRAAQEMLGVDKNMAKINSHRIDQILQGDDDGQEKVHEGET